MIVNGEIVARATEDGPAAVLIGGQRLDFDSVDAAQESGCGTGRVTVLPKRVFDSIPSGPDPLFAALDRDVDVERITPEPAYRDNCDTVYRADGRAPEVIFAEGFAPKDTKDGQYDVKQYVLKNQPSPFVSTTYRDDLYKAWKSPYYYYVDAPGGIDVNETIGDDHKYADQAEVAFPGGIDTRFIVMGCPVDRETLTIDESECEANPNYRPWRR
ncbi:ADP-ribosyltransferase [Stackebrandtia soli]|uniref:ADP-ribosyltransferase n=1 Tax=Stackebrandtia soli TaxID=1892856 RepID=UPI0039E9E152